MTVSAMSISHAAYSSALKVPRLKPDCAKITPFAARDHRQPDRYLVMARLADEEARHEFPHDGPITEGITNRATVSDSNRAATRMIASPRFGYQTAPCGDQPSCSFSVGSGLPSASEYERCTQIDG